MHAQLVHPSLLSEIWPRVSGWIEKALDKGDRWWSLDGLKNQVESNPDTGLFVLLDKSGMYGVFVITVETKPDGSKEATVNVCGGTRMRDWIDCITQLEDWARSKGATSVGITGRRGWQRMLDRRGYKPQAILLEKQL